MYTPLANSSSNWDLRLRPRPYPRPPRIATTVRASPSQPTKRNSSGVVDVGPDKKRQRTERTQSSNNKRQLDLPSSNDFQRIRLTREALENFEAATTLGIPNLTSMPQATKPLSESLSTLSLRSYSPQSAPFRACLVQVNVDFEDLHEPNEDDVDKLLKVMEMNRVDSPEPDSTTFEQTLAAVKNENETTVMIRMLPLLLPIRDLPSNNFKTSSLHYRCDTLLKGFGSSFPGLPIPKPDLLVGIKRSAFSPDQLTHITSPYQDLAGFCPQFVWEVKSAMQGPKVADLQNTNNAVSILSADFDVQQRLGLNMEKRVRLITTALNTQSQWYTAWFFVLDTNGKPKWCYKVIKQYNFQIASEKGFEAALAANLNLCEYLERVILPKLRDELAVVPESLPTPADSVTDAPRKRARITKPATNTHPRRSSRRPIRKES